MHGSKDFGVVGARLDAHAHGAHDVSAASALSATMDKRSKDGDKSIPRKKAKQKPQTARALGQRPEAWLGELNDARSALQLRA
jgi:hypothetical protein